MRIVIFHHHLNPGGVTRIIQSQIRSILETSKEISIVLITGYCPDRSKYENARVKVYENPELNYLPAYNYTRGFLEDNYKIYYRYLKSILLPDDILHLHNINLGKNPVLTLVFFDLALEGFKTINHCHDFAEDRPDNYKNMQLVIEDEFEQNLRLVMYPDIEDYKFVTLNSNDFTRISDYSIPDHRSYLMPNPVNLDLYLKPVNISKSRQNITKILNIDENKILVVYPVRVIKRKNIGEFILLSYLFKDISSWLVTQSPKNPLELSEYNSWKEYCSLYNLDVQFEVGEKVDFEELISACDFCITTSTREGFGMVYMEPWLLDTPVIGRNVSYVTQDLKEKGMVFPALYEKLLVDFDNKEIDFKDVSTDQQKEIITEIISDNKMKELLFKRNPFLNTILSAIDNTIIKNNKQIVSSKYSLKNYGEKLNEIYREITNQT